MKTITYSDLFIPELDQKYIDSLIDEYDIDCSQLDITYVFEDLDHFTTYRYTNAIICEIMTQIVINSIEDEHDRGLLIDNIFTNCFDSHYDIDDTDALHTQEAKDLVTNF